MTVDQHTAVALLNPIGVQATVNTLDVTLDESWSPYCRATVVCALPNPDDRDSIDLRDESLFLDLRLRQDFGAPWSLADLTALVGGSIAALTALLGGQPLGRITNLLYKPWNGSTVRRARSRSLRLYVTDRVFNDATSEMTLTAASMEARLLGDALVSDSPLDPGSTSLRAIVNSVLARYGTTISDGTSDATVAEANATIWLPGVTAWAYLDPMLEAASLRLWSDELGNFHLTERQSAIDGVVAITPVGTMTGHIDSMTLDPEVWFDAVIIEYRWVDEFDLNQSAFDYAGASPARAAKTIKRDGVRYPGPGAAAGILNRAQGRGRVLDIEAVSDYTIAPGMAAVITPPDTEQQNGYVTSVVFRLPDAEMNVTTRGLVDTPDTAYIFGPEGVSYLDVPVGVDYTEFDWSMV